MKDRAFTLIEVMLAVAIFGMVILAINGVFFAGLRLRNVTTRALEESLPLQQATAIIRHDLDGIVAPGGILGGSMQSGASSSSSMAQPGATLFYTCTGAIDDTSPWAEVQKVSYYLRDPFVRSTKGGKDLVRSVTRNLLTSIQEEPVEQWLLGDVAQLQFMFYLSNQWTTTWDGTTQTSTLPQAIKVQIAMANGLDERPRNPVELVVPVMVEIRTNTTQAASSQGGGGK